MNPRPFVKWVLVGITLLFSCSGPQASDALDISEPNQELARTEGNLDNYVRQLTSALKTLETSSDSLTTLDPTRLTPPFPSSAFKHALISCLNLTVEQSESSAPELVEVAKRFEITCAVPAIGELDRKLERGTDDSKFATDALRELDEVRINRRIAQQLLRDLPDQLARTNAFLGARKSELRKTRATLQRRKADYSANGYTESVAKLATYEIELEKVGERVFEIDARRPEWTKFLGSEIDSLYKSLTTLGEQIDIQRTEVERESE